MNILVWNSKQLHFAETIIIGREVYKSPHQFQIIHSEKTVVQWHYLDLLKVYFLVFVEFTISEQVLEWLSEV